MSDRRCAICGGELPADARVDAKFCSPACRQKAARGRDASDAQAVIGGIACPASAFECDSYAFGRIGGATLTVPAYSLRDVEFRHSAAGTLPVELRLGDTLVFEGDVERIVHAADTVQVIAQDCMSRLARQRWNGGTWEHLTVMQFAEGAAQRAGLTWTPPEAALDSRTLISLAEADGNSGGGSRNALELLLSASRELGYQFAVRDGALVFGPVLPAEPRAIAGRNVVVTTRDTTRCEIIARSSVLTLAAGAMQPRWIRTGSIAAVAAGRPVYVVTAPAEQAMHMHGRAHVQVPATRQHELDTLHARLVAEIGRDLLVVEADTDASDLRPYDRIKLEAIDKPLIVTQVAYRFDADAGLVTRVEALHLPTIRVAAAGPTRPAPRIVMVGGMAA